MPKSYESYGIEEIGGVKYYVGYKKSIPSFTKKSKANDEPKFDIGGLAVRVKEKIYVFDKQKYYCRLEYLTSANGEYAECDYDPQTDTCQTLKGKGVDVTSNTFPILEEWIQKQMRPMTTTYKHENIGWDDRKTVNGKRNKGKPDPFYKHWTAKISDSITSEYSGNFEIEPKGTYAEWRKGVKQNVIGYMPLEAGLAIALSGVTVGYLSLVYPGLTYPNIIFNIPGKSTTGKSTTCQLAISSIGCPDPLQGEASLMGTWNQSENNVFARLFGMWGGAVCYDELKSNDCKKLGKLLYNLYGGRDKGRMNKEATSSRKSEKWSLCLMSTGESSILDNITDGADGIMNRCYEFYDLQMYKEVNGAKQPCQVKWTKSAKNANDISAFISQNYGHATPIFADFILKKANTIEELYNYCKEHYKILREKENPDGYSDRRAKFIAPVLLTALLMESCFQFDINWKEMAKFFLLNERSQVPEHLRMYEYIKELIYTQKLHFVDSDTEKDFTPSQIWGRIEEKNYTFNEKKVISEVVLLPDNLESLLKKKGCSNPKRIMSALKDDGYVIPDKDGRHNKIPRRDPSNPKANKRCYVIRIFDED